MKEIAGLLRLTPPQVYETATFYTMLNLKPVGKFHLQVCKSLMCGLAGSDTVIGWVKTKLGIDRVKRRPIDSLPSAWSSASAACGTAPVMQVNEDYYERLKKKHSTESWPISNSMGPVRSRPARSCGLNR